MIDSALIERARDVRIEDEITRREIRLQGRGERVGPCPVCGGVDRFSINTKKQIFNCRGCGKGGDVIALVMHIDGVLFADAIAVLTGDVFQHGTESVAKRNTTDRQQYEVGKKSPKGGEKVPTQSEDDPKQLWADRIWREAVPIVGTPGEEYLIGRGINIADVPEHGGLRFHSRCPWEDVTTPCIVARYTTVIGNEPRGIWRRPINGQKPKSLGPTTVCVIRLWPDEAVTIGLVLGEGVETTLAAATRITYRGTLLRPAWAAGGTPNIRTFPPLHGIEALTLLVDNDAPDHHGRHAGQEAAEACAQVWLAAGKEVIRLTPKKSGTDFNDVVRGE